MPPLSVMLRVLVPILSLCCKHRANDPITTFSLALLNDQHVKHHMEVTPDAANSASTSPGHPYKPLPKHRSVSLSGDPRTRLVARMRRHKSEQALLPTKLNAPVLKRADSIHWSSPSTSLKATTWWTAQPRSFYAHVVQTQARRHLSESFVLTQNKLEAPQPERADTRVPPVVFALVVCDYHIGLIAGAVLILRPNHTCIYMYIHIYM